jgi:hypothetical protein
MVKPSMENGKRSEDKRQLGQRGPAVSDLKTACELGNDIGYNELQVRFGTGY